MKLVINDSEHAEMKSFYEAELIKSVKRLQHIQTILGQLKSDVKVEIVVAGIQQDTEPKPRRTSRKKTRGKRGRKSIWGEFILQTLKDSGRPLKYSDIVTAARVKFNIPEKKMKTLKAAINQSAFRLRTIHNQIETIGEVGKKEKLLALSKWVDSNGNLKT
jgi:c-di-GMP-related signal transduction protein